MRINTDSNKKKNYLYRAYLVCANQGILIRISAVSITLSDAILVDAHLNRAMETGLQLYTMIERLWDTRVIVYNVGPFVKKNAM